MLIIICILLSSEIVLIAQNNTWSDIYSKDFLAPDAPIHSISANQLGIFVAGWIREVNFNTDKKMVVRNIAKWKDSVWEGVGGNGPINGVNGTIYSISYDSQNLYVCGEFDTAGNIASNRITAWDGNSWQSLGNTTPPYRNISSLCAYNGSVYVGGKYDSIGGQIAYSIAKYNGSTWSTLGSGFRKMPTPQSISFWGEVSAIACRGTDVYVGGIFDTAGMVTAKNIAKWNGTEWQSMGAGIKGVINAIIAMPNGDVYVGGMFDSAGTVATKNIAKWNGTEWCAINGLSGNIVYSLANDSNNLYVGGDFRIQGLDSSTGLAMWDGENWNSVGGGISGSVYCMNFYDGSLYVGGHFGSVGNERLSVFNIAKWQVREPIESENMQMKPNEIIVRSYPNPNVSDNVTIEFELKDAGMTTIQVLTAQGEIVEELSRKHFLAGNHIISWKIPQKTSSQAYFCRIIQNGNVKVNNIT